MGRFRLERMKIITYEIVPPTPSRGQARWSIIGIWILHLIQSDCHMQKDDEPWWIQRARFNFMLFGTFQLYSLFCLHMSITNIGPNGVDHLSGELWKKEKRRGTCVLYGVQKKRKKEKVRQICYTRLEITITGNFNLMCWSLMMMWSFIIIIII